MKRVESKQILAVRLTPEEFLSYSKEMSQLIKEMGNL